MIPDPAFWRGGVVYDLRITGGYEFRGRLVGWSGPFLRMTNIEGAHEYENWISNVTLACVRKATVVKPVPSLSSPARRF